jgi:hypothetical protein
MKRILFLIAMLLSTGMAIAKDIHVLKAVLAPHKAGQEGKNGNIKPVPEKQMSEALKALNGEELRERAVERMAALHPQIPKEKCSAVTYVVSRAADSGQVEISAYGTDPVATEKTLNAFLDEFLAWQSTSLSEQDTPENKQIANASQRIMENLQQLKETKAKLEPEKSGKLKPAEIEHLKKKVTQLETEEGKLLPKLHILQRAALPR